MQYHRFTQGIRLSITFFLLINISTAFPLRTVGLFKHTESSTDSGYVFFAPVSYGNAYLIDKCGHLVHQWADTAHASFSTYLLNDGSILRAVFGTGTQAGSGAVLERIDWDGRRVWHYVLVDATMLQHHDVRLLPNGNILVLANDFHSAGDAFAQGKDAGDFGNTLASEEIVEIKPIGTDSGTIVWKWRVWDHLIQENQSAALNYGVVANHPELVNINFPAGTPNRDWLHANAIDYNPARDQILLSCYNSSEVWIIDHSTSTSEAASHAGGRYGKGGDLLYRWGNPQAYNQGSAADQKFFGQHNAQWISAGLPRAGSIVVFNNGVRRSAGTFSSIDIFSPAANADGSYSTATLPFAPAAQSWTYTDAVPVRFFSPGSGGVQMLADGNVLICSGIDGRMFEVDSLGNEVWEYVNPVGVLGPVAQGVHVASSPFPMFRCTFHSGSSAAFVGKGLTAGAQIETNPLPDDCTLNSDTAVQCVVGRAGMVNPLSLHNDTVEVGSMRNDTMILVNRMKFTPLTVSSIDMSGPYATDYIGVRLILLPLQPLTRDTLVFRFRPSDCFSRTAACTIQFSNPGIPPVSIALNGFGGCKRVSFGKPDTLFSTTRLIAGVGDASALDTLAITNIGSLPIRILHQEINGSNQSEYSIQRALPDSVVPGATATAIVKFAPVITDTNPKHARYVIETNCDTGIMLSKELRGWLLANHPGHPTIGVVLHTTSSLDTGYVLFAPFNDSTYLIDKCGRVVHIWPSGQPGNSFVSLQPNGNILRGGMYPKLNGSGNNGTLQLIDWEGNVLWNYVINDATHKQHFDAIMLPNGNVLCTVLEYLSPSEAIATGRDTSGWPGAFGVNALVELQPVGHDSAIAVWEWHARDHVIQNRDPALSHYGVVADQPELINIKYSLAPSTQTDWLQINSVRFDSTNNLIMVSVHNLGEIWMIDHSTTLHEASTHSGGHFGRGGDLIYRWGNPAAYHRGTIADQTLFMSNCAQWISKGLPRAGSVMVFNDGVNRPDGNYSSVEIFSPVIDSPGVQLAPNATYLPVRAEITLKDSAPSDFYSPMLGGAQMLPHEHVLLSNGTSGMFFEMDSLGRHVWEYKVPVNAKGPIQQGADPTGTGIFNCWFYPHAYPAFAGRDLRPGKPIELNTFDNHCQTTDDGSAVRQYHPLRDAVVFDVYPNPARDHISISSQNVRGSFALINALGQQVFRADDASALSAASIPAGVYTLLCRSSNGTSAAMVVVAK